MGQINMRDTRVEEVEHISDSDSDDTNRVDKSVLQPTIGKDTLNKREVYLHMSWTFIFMSKNKLWQKGDQEGDMHS